MSDAKVITVTLNPSLDRTLVTHYLAVGYHNRTTETTRLDPGGRGVVISRALHILQIPTHGIISLGDDATGSAYEALIAREEFPVTIVKGLGLTRSNIVILDTGNQSETTLIEESRGATRERLQSVVQVLRKMIVPDDIVIFAGSLPNDAPPDTYAWLITIAREAGAAYTVLDTYGDALNRGLKAKPHLVLFSQNEAEGLFNYPVRTREDMIYSAQKLREQEIREVLIFGEDGNAIMVSGEGTWHVELPETETQGTRGGVREAMLAGIVARLAQQMPVIEALEMGAAAAMFTASRVGSIFGTLNEIMEYVNTVEVKPEVRSEVAAEE